MRQFPFYSYSKKRCFELFSVSQSLCFSLARFISFEYFAMFYIMKHTYIFMISWRKIKWNHLHFKLLEINGYYHQKPKLLFADIYFFWFVYFWSSLAYLDTLVVPAIEFKCRFFTRSGKTRKQKSKEIIISVPFPVSNSYSNIFRIFSYL